MLSMFIDFLFFFDTFYFFCFKLFLSYFEVSIPYYWFYIPLQILCTMGIRYDNVLPVPVGAVTRTFLSYNKAGIVCICTGVGFFNPISAIPSSNFPLILYLLPITSKLQAIKGTSVPQTFIRYFFLRLADLQIFLLCQCFSLYSLNFFPYYFSTQCSSSSLSDQVNRPVWKQSQFEDLYLGVIFYQRVLLFYRDFLERVVPCFRNWKMLMLMIQTIIKKYKLGFSHQIKKHYTYKFTRIKMFLTKKASGTKATKAKNSKALGGWDDQDQKQQTGISSNVDYKKFHDNSNAIQKPTNTITKYQNYNNQNLVDGDDVQKQMIGGYKSVSGSLLDQGNNLNQNRAWSNQNSSKDNSKSKNIQTQNFYTAQQLAQMTNIQCQCKVVQAVLIPGGVRVKPNDTLLSQFYNQTKSLNIPIIGSLLICHLYNPEGYYQIKAKCLYCIQFLCKKSVQYSVYFKLHAEKIKNSPNCQQNLDNYLKIKKNLLSLLGTESIRPENRSKQQNDLLTQQQINYVDPGYSADDKLINLAEMATRKNSQKQRNVVSKKLISPSQVKNKQKKVLTGPGSIKATIPQQKKGQQSHILDLDDSNKKQLNLLDDAFMNENNKTTQNNEKTDNKFINLLDNQQPRQDPAALQHITFDQLLQKQKSKNKPQIDFTF